MLDEVLRIYYPKKQLSLNDISIGMRVNPRSLSKIMDTLILLTNFDGNDEFGEIVYIGDPDTEESDKLYSDLDDVCTVYNSKADIEDFVV